MMESIHVRDIFPMASVSYELMLGWARYSTRMTLRSSVSLVETNLARALTWEFLGRGICSMAWYLNDASSFFAFLQYETI